MTTQSNQVPDFAPGEFSEDTARKQFERGGETKVHNNRMFVIACIQGIAIILLAIAVYSLFPLKTVETQLVHSEAGGRLVAEGQAVGNWTPDHDNIAYFINKWADSVFDINAATIQRTIRESAEFTIGNATQQLKDLRIKDNPLVLLKSNPNLIRSYEFITINFYESDVALLRFKTITRSNDTVKEVTYAMRVTFVRVKPTTRQQIVRNPGGLFIKSFNLTEEDSK